MALNYTKKTVNHFLKPKNVGKIAMEIYLCCNVLHATGNQQISCSHLHDISGMFLQYSADQSLNLDCPFYIYCVRHDNRNTLLPADTQAGVLFRDRFRDMFRRAFHDIFRIAG